MNPQIQKSLPTSPKQETFKTTAKRKTKKQYAWAHQSKIAGKQREVLKSIWRGNNMSQVSPSGLTVIRSGFSRGTWAGTPQNTIGNDLPTLDSIPRQSILYKECGMYV